MGRLAILHQGGRRSSQTNRPRQAREKEALLSRKSDRKSECEVERHLLRHSREGGVYLPICSVEADPALVEDRGRRAYLVGRHHVVEEGEKVRQQSS